MVSLKSAMAGTNPSDPLKKENGVNVLVLTQGMALILYGTEKIAIEQWHTVSQERSQPIITRNQDFFS